MTIIENLQLNFDDGDKISIIGRNGIGKSTLFNLIVCKYKSDIEVSNLSDFAYFGKDANLNFESTLEKEVTLFKEDIDFKKYNVLKNGFHFHNFDRKAIKNLSQGNKIKAELIFILALKSKNIFLLDEPTESLDKETILFLGNFIKQSKKTFIIISHDQSFVDDFSTKKYIFQNKNLITND